MCGIQVDGENHFTITPCPGGHFTHAEAEYVSAYGCVKGAWQKMENSFVFTITIPANCTAAVTLPGRKPQELTAGEYTLESAYK